MQCSCPKPECPNHSNCSSCVAKHREAGNLPFCLRKEDTKMVRHIVMWNYADGFSPEENTQNARKMKALLEELPGLIDGIVELKVQIDAMPSSNRDIMLDSLFESEEALAAYIVHPEHKRVGEFVRAVTKDRACVDYRE